jgi:hypothetical protein
MNTSPCPKCWTNLNEKGDNNHDWNASALHRGRHRPPCCISDPKKRKMVDYL